MKLSELVDRVRSTDEEVVITKNGRPAAVLVSAEEFESWKETIEILSSNDLMDEIRRVGRAREREQDLHARRVAGLDREEAMRYRLSVPDETADFLRSLHPEIKRKDKSGLESDRVGTPVWVNLSGTNCEGSRAFRSAASESSTELHQNELLRSSHRSAQNHLRGNLPPP